MDSGHCNLRCLVSSRAFPLFRVPSEQDTSTFSIRGFVTNRHGRHSPAETERAIPTPAIFCVPCLDTPCPFIKCILPSLFPFQSSSSSSLHPSTIFFFSSFFSLQVCLPAPDYLEVSLPASFRGGLFCHSFGLVLVTLSHSLLPP